MAKTTNTKKSETKNSSKKTKTVKAVSKTTPKKNYSKKRENRIIQTENNYGRTILAALLIIVVLIGGYLAVQYKKNHGEGIYIQTSEEKKFKEEYESLNGVENAKSISIMKDNNIKYISLDEAKEILDSKTGVIYFGTPSCAWSRNAVPVMLDAMQEAKLDTIYYVNVRPDNKKENDIRDEYTLDSRGKAKKTKDASESYYNILLSLANNLKEYVLTSDAGKKVSTGEKRLNTPTVVAVKNGVVIGFHEGTLNSNLLDKDGNLTDLTADQEKELKSIYVKIFEKYKDENCTDENC